MHAETLFPPAPVLRTAAPAAIEARHLTKRFDGLTVVSDMSLAVAQGEMVGLIGPNGAGKTTMFNLLAGSLKPSSGEIWIGGREVSGEPPERRIAHGVARTFQIPRPFSEMSVLENLLVGAQKQHGERLFANFLTPGLVRREEEAALEKALGLLEFVTLSRLAHEPARVLSGGQRKLLELARVLMADPQVILLDEPAAGVNPALLEVIIERVVALNAQGKSILLIEHNMDMVSRLCSRVVAMALGKPLAQGTPAEVASNPAVIEAYLGGGA
ncbi:MAG: ABC transporter ATP-binding protein [Alphaproteobacteria bacterium]|nr:ABC transporter ATP-binding protein [Rhizobiaceae bacterium]MBU3959317.1 ABC transporter ATP-binding protein [Alphaproteobacteria bacterium]MBU4050032.1 ABC transporter ATP-binding protein [Alphaproteobacteria bacterium]MBU4089422.1 ABC transporter ATP-binding protein [Alphaproteobacteria bacterium]MBU4155339.1 ABC transporter ATP-binding protein [Alphaproteobacteria bacterium]